MISARGVAFARIFFWLFRVSAPYSFNEAVTLYNILLKKYLYFCVFLLVFSFYLLCLFNASIEVVIIFFFFFVLSSICLPCLLSVCFLLLPFYYLCFYAVPISMSISMSQLSERHMKYRNITYIWTFQMCPN